MVFFHLMYYMDMGLRRIFKNYIYKRKFQIPSKINFYLEVLDLTAHSESVENNLRYSYCSEISCSTGN